MTLEQFKYYILDGHKLILVEGIPTLFSWENIEQFDGKSSQIGKLEFSVKKLLNFR